jgi:hypothetical protein
MLTLDAPILLWSPRMRHALLAVLLCPAVLAAQTRKIEGEVSGSVFFGNTEQTLASTRAQYERSDSGFTFRTLARFNYGELTPPLGSTLVNKRSWEAAANYDYRPFADFTPFIKVAVESSLENRIERRYSAGAGARYNIVRTPGTDVIFSAGAAGEGTTSMPPGDSTGTIVLARGSTSLKIRRAFNERVSFTTETSYQPALTESGDYTITSVNTLKSQLARFAALTLTFRDNYDSQAVLRGARVNNDGEVLVGILTTF